MPFENAVEEGEDAGNHHFLLFQKCFLPFPKQVSIYSYFVICICFKFEPVQNFVIW